MKSDTGRPGPALGSTAARLNAPHLALVEATGGGEPRLVNRELVTIVREAGTTVDLDCMGIVPDDRFTTVTGTNYEVANIDLDIDGVGGEGSCVDGAQFITASAPVGIAVGGYDCAASYGYPGGLALDELWVPPHVPPG